ncbi:uncharacterized protein KY384_007769 [Bacidia gigantensis]|uniref:uncharacterized protein n=1 Tax=Bacidia gigantensis TaxID=2732470 RepID=UPI001D0408A1|nr:uncharacterized protein KY384_007769 [Bacidia gigantensis]KAG8527616.1 hypothetical protein KY384_007769 [Bacidia gigantensis]
MDYQCAIFHPPFPRSLEDVLSPFYRSVTDAGDMQARHERPRACQCCGHSNVTTPSLDELSHENLGRFASLPVELVDEILTYLSIPALDAARLTSFAWWRRIMSSPTVVASALGRNSRVHLRDLAIAFEESASLTQVYQHPDSWRSRFRIHDISVRLPRMEHEHSRSNLDAVQLSGEGNFLVMRIPVVHQTRLMNSFRESSTLLFYRFEVDNTPVYIGYASHLKVNGPLIISTVAEIERQSGWTVEIEVDSHVQKYAITRRNGWSNGESPYILRDVTDPTHHPKDFFCVAVQRKPTKIEGNALLPSDWQLLSRIPSNEKAVDDDVVSSTPLFSPIGNSSSGDSESRPSEGNLRRHLLEADLSYMVARSAAEELYVVSAPYEHSNQHESIAAAGSSGTVITLAQLINPISNSIFRNVAISPYSVVDIKIKPVIRIAVLWQHTPLTLASRSELYLYEVPTSLFAHAPSSSSPSPPYPTLIYGIRIHSLPVTLGGIHPSSTIQPLPNPYPPYNPLPLDIKLRNRTLSYAKSAGGLRFPSRPSKSERWNRLSYELYAWGPVSATKTMVKVFDFGFADPGRLKASRKSKIWGEEGAGSGSVRGGGADGKVGWWNSAPGGEYGRDGGRGAGCACSLHDEYWDVEAPDVSVPYLPDFYEALRRERAISRGKTSWWPGKWPFAVAMGIRLMERVRPNVGRVERKESVEQKEGRERKDMFLRRRIVAMQKAGMGEEGIKHEWQWSLTPRPRGWERDWEGWARDEGLE